MKVKTTYTGCDYITAGKEYEVEEDYGPDWGIIVDDFGSRIVYRSRQEIFDIAYLGLEGQGFERSTDGEMCLYRGPEGKKCAVGHLIDYDDYTRKLEGSDATNKQVLEAAKILEEDSLFVSELQGKHDNSVSPQDMKARLITFAQEYGLKVPG